MIPEDFDFNAIKLDIYDYIAHVDKLREFYCLASYISNPELSGSYRGSGSVIRGTISDVSITVFNNEYDIEKYELSLRGEVSKKSMEDLLKLFQLVL